MARQSSIHQHLKDLLSKQQARTQEDMKQFLEQRGVSVNQSTISRALRALGAVKSTTPNGKIVYRLFTDNRITLESIQPLILSLEGNSQMIAVKTQLDSATTVARYIDESETKTIMATLAGDETILIIPADIKKYQDTFKEIADLLGLEV